MRSLDSSISKIFAFCRDYYLANAHQKLRRGELYKNARRTLKNTLQAMAALHEELYKHLGYSVDTDHPGYLVKFDPPKFLRVPYHVLPAFPSGAELDALWDLSRKIRSSDHSTISISGSNVLRKLFNLVGDIDFCEYLPLRDAHGFARIVANMNGDDRTICLKVAVGNQAWSYPWDKGTLTAAYLTENVDSTKKEKSTLKMDYVGEVDSFGVTEVSNLIIAVGLDGKSAGFERTFAAQEVPLIPVDWLPNQMNDPLEMGRYIDWLVSAIVALRDEDDTRKCMKRCASLSRVLFLPEITDEIASLVDGHESILLVHQLKALDELCQELKSLGDDQRATRLAGLVDIRKKTLSDKLAEFGTPDEQARQQFARGARSIADRLLAHVQLGPNRSFGGAL